MFQATKHPVLNRGVCPDEVLSELVTFGKNATDEVFAVNSHYDIYSLLAGTLGPYTSLSHRRAVMLEVLRVDGAMESSWNWTEGTDASNPSSLAHPEQAERGMFQVSYDSHSFDPSLSACLVKYTGSSVLSVFLQEMKDASQKQLQIEYCARLFRFNVNWSGPAKHGVIASLVRRDCVSEFQSLLAV